jgi:hypothetical protein
VIKREERERFTTTLDPDCKQWAKPRGSDKERRKRKVYHYLGPRLQALG